MLVLLVAKIAKCIFRKNNVFTLVFDLSVAEVAACYVIPTNVRLCSTSW